MKSEPTKLKIKNYIFITDEGFTFQPGSEDYEPDIENMQVIGFGKGTDSQGALNNMIKENPYIKNTKFTKAIGIEITGSKQCAMFTDCGKNKKMV